MKNKIFTTLSCIAGIGGLYFLGVLIKYLISYFSEPNNPLRHEYLQGVAISLLISMPFWIIASASMILIKDIIPTFIYRCVNTVTVLICCMFLLANLYPLLMFVLGKQGHLTCRWMNRRENASAFCASQLGRYMELIYE